MAEEAEDVGFGFEEDAPAAAPATAPSSSPTPPVAAPNSTAIASPTANVVGMTPAEAAAQGDDLDGIEDALGDAFALPLGSASPASASTTAATLAPHAQHAGYADGEYAGDPNIAPRLAAAPRDVPVERSYDVVVLRWDSLRGQIVHELRVQGMPVPAGAEAAAADEASRAAFAGGFAKARGGVEVVVPDATETNCAWLAGLTPETAYAFRLVARNDAGTTESAPSRVLRTLRYAPPRGDKSGWLVVLPDRRKVGTVKTLGRRLSLRKRGPDRFFFVIDGTLLSWYKAVDGEEVGYIHLSKLKEITYPRNKNNTVFTLHYGDDERLELDCTSESPAYTTAENLKDWVATLTDIRKNLGGGSVKVKRETME